MNEMNERMNYWDLTEIDVVLLRQEEKNCCKTGHVLANYLMI